MQGMPGFLSEWQAIGLDLLASSLSYLMNTIDSLGDLWDRYFNIAGFIIGGVTILLIYFAGASENKKSGFISSLAVIALLNSLGPIYGLLTQHVLYRFGGWEAFYRFGGWNQWQWGSYWGWQLRVFEAAVNPLAAAIIVVVVFSCYKDGRYNTYAGNAFCFGVITYGVALLMHYYMLPMVGIRLGGFLVVRAVALGVICIFLARLKYLHTGIILFAVYFAVFRAVQFAFGLGLILDFDLGFNFDFSIEIAANIGRLLVPELAAFGVIFLVFLLYERVILTVKPSTPSGRKPGYQP